MMIAASFDFGVTWDEKSRHRYGELIWDFWAGRIDRSAAFPEDGGHLYGGLFDVISVGAERWLPGNRYVIRHVIDAIFGWIGIVYCGRLAARLFGVWTGTLAMLLLVTSPRYFADAMNNPKDLPFAALAVVALYYLSTISPKWPYVSASTAFKIVLALALALNVRSGALVYLGYFGLLIAAFVVVERNWQWRRLADTTVRVAVIVAATLLLGTICWPWAQAAPFTRPFEALLGFANYPYGGLVLFDGREYDAASLPWYYAPWWLVISTPPVVLAGALLSLVPRASRAELLRTALLWTVVVIPAALVIYNRSTLYDGVRHLLFIYPALIVIAAAGWTEWLSTRRQPWVRRTAAALLAVGLMNILAFNVRAYPNQTVYFNEVVGGPRGAMARYDLDYWGNCVLEAVSWTARVAKASGMSLTITGNPAHVVELDAGRFRELFYTIPERGRDHFIVRLNRGPIAGVTELANRMDAPYRVTTPDGAVLCVVLPGAALAQPHPPSLVIPVGGRE